MSRENKVEGFLKGKIDRIQQEFEHKKETVLRGAREVVKTASRNKGGSASKVATPKGVFRIDQKRGLDHLGRSMDRMWLIGALNKRLSNDTSDADVAILAQSYRQMFPASYDEFKRRWLQRPAGANYSAKPVIKDGDSVPAHVLLTSHQRYDKRARSTPAKARLAIRFDRLVKQAALFYLLGRKTAVVYKKARASEAFFLERLYCLTDHLGVNLAQFDKRLAYTLDVKSLVKQLVQLQTLGFVHMDLKPGNIMVKSSAHGESKERLSMHIADCNDAMPIGEKTKRACGTIRYMHKTVLEAAILIMTQKKAAYPVTVDTHARLINDYWGLLVSLATMMPGLVDMEVLELEQCAELFGQSKWVRSARLNESRVAALSAEERLKYNDLIELFQLLQPLNDCVPSAENLALYGRVLFLRLAFYVRDDLSLDEFKNAIYRYLSLAHKEGLIKSSMGDMLAKSVSLFQDKSALCDLFHDYCEVVENALYDNVSPELLLDFVVRHFRVMPVELLHLYRDVCAGYVKANGDAYECFVRNIDWLISARAKPLFSDVVGLLLKHYNQLPDGPSKWLGLTQVFKLSPDRPVVVSVAEVIIHQKNDKVLMAKLKPLLIAYINSEYCEHGERAFNLIYENPLHYAQLSQEACDAALNTLSESELSVEHAKKAKQTVAALTCWGLSSCPFVLREADDSSADSGAARAAGVSGK